MVNSDQITTGHAPVHNGQLYYEVAGSGKTLLFIHAGVADHEMWDTQFTYFSQYFRVIRYDARGFGKSRTESTAFSDRQDILDLFSHLGVDQAVLVGASRGGALAIDFTLEHPGCVSALVAVAAGISGFDYDPAGDEQSLIELELFNRMDELWEKKAYDELTDLQVHMWADGPSQPGGRASPGIRDYMRKVVRSSFDRQDGQARPIPLDPPAFSRLADIYQPALVLIGEYDTRAVQFAASELECQVPHARKVGFPKTAHMIPMEQPGKFNSVVLDFLKEAL